MNGLSKRRFGLWKERSRMEAVNEMGTTARSPFRSLLAPSWLQELRFATKLFTSESEK
jgi:hypothetical protein